MAMTGGPQKKYKLSKPISGYGYVYKGAGDNYFLTGETGKESISVNNAFPGRLEQIKREWIANETKGYKAPMSGGPSQPFEAQRPNLTKPQGSPWGTQTFGPRGTSEIPDLTREKTTVPMKPGQTYTPPPQRPTQTPGVGLDRNEAPKNNQGIGPAPQATGTQTNTATQQKVMGSWYRGNDAWLKDQRVQREISRMTGVANFDPTNREQVRKVQSVLSSSGYGQTMGAIDGLLGEKTLGAMKQALAYATEEPVAVAQPKTGYVAPASQTEPKLQVSTQVNQRVGPRPEENPPMQTFSQEAPVEKRRKRNRLLGSVKGKIS